jgi:protein-tyrosine phosphatase
LSKSPLKAFCPSMQRSDTTTTRDGWRPNLSWITHDLAIGGSFPSRRAEGLARSLGIRAVVDLRAESRHEEALLRRSGIELLYLPTEDHCAISQAMLREGVAFVNARLEREERVLVHCEHGIGRSATLALCVLVSRGLPPVPALELAKTRRSLVSPSPAQYEAWITWLEGWKAASGAPWELPSFDAFCAIAYRHLQGA